MSALTDLFTSMANKIRSKTGTATTYTPAQMVSDGIDDVYAAGYDAGGGGAAGIPITPSNASPVSLTTGESYEMLADGYAVSSYSSITPSDSTPETLYGDNIYKASTWGYAIRDYTTVTPSNTPVTLTTGKFYKMGGDGKAVATINDITPSSNMPAMTGGAIYKPAYNGYAISSYTALTPSDSSPVPLSAQTVYRVTNGSSGGYAIASYQSKTPSASGTAFDAGFVKMSQGGYAYSSQPPACKAGSATLSTSTTTTITLGFTPKYICYRVANNSNPYVLACYDERFSTTKYLAGTTAGSVTQVSVGTTNAFGLASISSTGFTVNKAASSATTSLQYFAMG